MSSKQSNDRSRGELRALVAITLLGTLLRAVVAWLTIDVPGDGPNRAAMAYAWSRAPGFVWFSYWPPGLLYLAGTLSILIPDPRIAPRLLNVILGGLSVPLLHAAAERAHGREVALVAATILAVFPLHVGLSASSLSEPALVFAMLGVVASAFAAARDPTRAAVPLAAMVSCAVMAEMVRYEAWVLLPLVIAYVVHRLRLRGLGVLLVVLLVAFPAFWCVQSYRNTGNALFGFAAAVTDAIGAQGVAPGEAMRLLWQGVREQVGGAAALVMVVACFDGAVRVLWRQHDAEQVLLGALAATAWAILFGYFLARGPTVWERLLVLAIVLTIPLAVASVWRWTSDRRLRTTIAAACLVSFGITIVVQRPPFSVTRTRQPQIEEFADWYRGSMYRDDFIVLTCMRWRARYVPLYAPDLADRIMAISELDTDEQILRFVRKHRPSLLVTEPADAALSARFERLFGAIGPQHLATTVRELLVFDIRHLASD